MTEKIKVSDIRAKFPMYGDLTDEQLLSAVRKKFYSDIPMAQFAKNIDFDTERARLDPTADMGPFDKFVAAYGGAVPNLLRGLGQFTPLVSRADVEEARRLEAPLMNTGAGKVGSVAGNVAAMIPAAFLPGANTMAGAGAYGAATGLAAPSTSTEETLKNTALGGLLGPASLLVGRGIGAAYEGLKGLIEPLTKSGQERVAAATLQQFAKDPKAAAAALQNAKELVPGSAPTMAQATADPGLAQLERTLANNPETGPAIASRLADQRAARLSAVQKVAGTDEYYNAVKEGRKVFANEDYAKAMREGFDKKMAEVLQPQIGALMERPSIQQAKSAAVNLAKEQNVSIKDWGSIEGLDWLKKGLDNVIDAASNPMSSIGKQKLAAMVQTKQDLMSVIEQVAPAYKAANDNFAAMSKQVNSMDAARAILDRMQSPLGRYGANTRELKNEYARALENAMESVKKSTGQNKPLSQVMDAKEVKRLEAVAQDMARSVNAEELGRAVGSNTAQNLSSQNLLRRTLGPTGLPQSWSESTALQTLLSPLTAAYRVGGADKKIMDRLVEAAMNPQDAAALMLLSRQPGIAGRIGRSVEGNLPFLPYSGLLAYPQQQ